MKKSTVQEVRETELEFKEPSSQTWRLDLENNRITKSIDQLEAVVQSAFMAQPQTLPVSELIPEGISIA